ncbi:MAG: GHMP kinase [bacterium]
MIITRTPFRISFAGGGSDLKDYYQNYGGAVLSTSINKYIYLSMHPYFQKDGYFLKYSNLECVDNINKIQHRIIKRVLDDYKIMGIDFNSSADIPSGTGLGSSSAFTAGLINLCNIYTQKYMKKTEIASYACEIEIDKLKEPIGKQDQYACAIGGLNFISFNQDDVVTTEKIALDKDKSAKLQNNLLMFYTGSERSASAILKEQKENIADSKKTKNLQKMVLLAYELRDELLRGNIDDFGEILHKGWLYKKELSSQISNEKIDYYYNLAMKNGASGGKLLGAGKNGFLLFYAKENKHKQLRDSLKDLNELDFEFESIGTTVIYAD